MSALFNRRYPAERESVPAARHAVIDALSGGGFHDPDLHSKVSLALTEATGNAVRHAYPEGVLGDVDVAVDRTADGIVIVVSDHGGGMRNGDQSAGGLGVGLVLMRAEAASLAVESDATGTTITLRFLAEPDRP